jgi:hypothetical protein
VTRFLAGAAVASLGFLAVAAWAAGYLRRRLPL